MNKYLYLPILLILLASCGVPRISNVTKVSDIKKLGMFKPLIHISTMNGLPDTTFSLQVQQKMIQSIDDAFPRTMDIYDIEIDSNMQKYYDELFLELTKNMSVVENYTTTNIFNKIVRELRKAKIDYALSVVDIGTFCIDGREFVMKDGRNSSKMNDNFVMSFIIDAKNSRFAFIKTKLFLRVNPNDKDTTDEMIHTLFDDYFKEL